MINDKKRQFFNYIFKQALDSSRKRYINYNSPRDEYVELNRLIYQSIEKVELDDYKEYDDTIYIGLLVYIKPVNLPQHLYDYIGETSLRKIVSISLLSDFERYITKYLGKRLNDKLTLYIVRELINVT